MPFADEPADAVDGCRAAYYGVPDVLAYLAGAWKVERTARDLAGNAEGHFSGTTVFTWLDGRDGAQGGAQDGAQDGDSDPGEQTGAGGGTDTGTDTCPGGAAPRTGAGTGTRTDTGTGTRSDTAGSGARTGPAPGTHPAPNGLLHHESGTFTWHGTARPAERTLRYLPGDDPATARVRFADGRPFHDLDLRTGHHRADHPCALDLYRGEFEVFDADHWRTRWRVAGPAKDLILTTDYVRASPA
jgi:hypothetical protein